MSKMDLFLMQDMPHSDFIQMARLAEASGCENLWVIDGQDVYPDPWTTAALCAVNTSRIRIGPGVTNPLTRHPRVTANAMLSIHELSAGRAILGLGTGDNAVRTLGWKPAKISVLREAVEICRQRFERERVDIPIYIAAGGPRLNVYACQAADGIIVPGIGTPQDLRRTLERVAQAAHETGRDLKTLPVLYYVGFSISRDRGEAYDEARGGLARRVLNFVYNPSYFPPELEPLRAEIDRIAAGYDYRDHLKSHVEHASLVSDKMVETAGIAGTPEDVIAKFQALSREAAGFEFSFFLRPDGRGKKRSFELFVSDVLPRLRDDAVNG